MVSEAAIPNNRAQPTRPKESRKARPANKQNTSPTTLATLSKDYLAVIARDAVKHLREYGKPHGGVRRINPEASRLTNPEFAIAARAASSTEPITIIDKKTGPVSPAAPQIRIAQGRDPLLAAHILASAIGV